MKNNIFPNNVNFFNKEIKRRKNWLRNNNDKKADKDWKIIFQKIKKNKDFENVRLAYNFSKNLKYNHPGLDSHIYFYHPLRVCILSTKIGPKLSSQLMTLCLLHNIFETTNMKKSIIDKIFGKKIGSELKILTVDRKKEWKKNYKKNYYANIKKANKFVIIVKILDKLDNLYLLRNNKNCKIRKKYLKEIEKYLMPLIKKELGNLYLHFENLIKFSKHDNGI
jgi:(p)ppGpp synthase/HD superfamily hydrolase